MMDDFARRYTQANTARDASVYQTDQFLSWLNRLEAVFIHPKMAVAVMVAILIAQRRGDAAANLVRDVTRSESDEFVKDLFEITRETVTLASPFVGLPNTMPANFGMIAVLKERGVESVESKSRPNFAEADYEKIGQDTFQALYRGVGNTEVGQMLGQYMPDLMTYNTVGIFGFLCGGSPMLSLKEAETIVVSAIIGLGATRQARSHTKAAMQLGVSVDVLAAIDAVAQEIARWNKSPVPEALNMAQLKVELSRELERLGVSLS